MPLPTPYQPESMWRFWVQANTQGMARRSPSVLACVRRAGREPMLSIDSSSSGLDACRYSSIVGSSMSFRYADHAVPDERFHRLVEFVHRHQRRLALGTQHVLDHRCAQQFDLIGRRAAIRVLERDDLALLGDAELAADGARRGGRDRASRGRAAAAHGAAAAVKERDGHAELATRGA